MERHKLSPEEEAFLEANPWCAARYNAPGNSTFTPGCRMTRPPPSIAELKDRLFSQVLKDTNAVPVVLGFHEAISIPAPSSSSSSSSITMPPKQDKFVVLSASLIFDLREGVRGFNGFTHGGFFGVLIDESVGNYLFVNSQETQAAFSAAEGGGSEADIKTFARDTGLIDWRSYWALTVGINTRLLKAMDPPAVVVARSSLDRVEGRKMWIKTIVEGEGGVVYATGESIWLLMKDERGKL